MISRFNLENGTPAKSGNGTETQDDYGISSYDKSKTQFDGVNSEMQVTYLQLRQDQGVEIPIMSTGKKNSNIDFTVMLYFKIDKDILNAQKQQKSTSTTSTSSTSASADFTNFAAKENDDVSDE